MRVVISADLSQCDKLTITSPLKLPLIVFEFLAVLIRRALH